MEERAASLYRLSLDRAYWYICAMPLPAHFSELLPQMKSLALLPNTLWKDDVQRAWISCSHCSLRDSLMASIGNLSFSGVLKMSWFSH